jgi:hypothetical protein
MITSLFESVVASISEHGKSGARLFVCKRKGANFIMKIYSFVYPYQGFDSKAARRNYCHGADAEVRILEILRDNLIAGNITPCLLEMVYHAEFKDAKTQLEMAKNKIKPHKDQDRGVTESLGNFLQQRITNIEQTFEANRGIIAILEKCDVTLGQYLQNLVGLQLEFTIIKSFIFQIAHILGAIYYLYPKFTHGDLHAENIMLKMDRDFRFNPAKPMFLVYKFGKNKYYVPYFGVVPKLMDFDLSILPELGIGATITKSNVYKRMTSDNDLDTLFESIRVYNPGAEILSMIDVLWHLGGTKKAYESIINCDIFEDYRVFNIGKELVYKKYKWFQ